MLHRALLHRAEQRAARTLGHRKPNTTYKALSYPAAHLCSSLRHVTSICKFPQLPYAKCLAHIEHFLQKLPIAPGDTINRGITWLELYIIYRLIGHPKPIDDPAMPPASTAQQLSRFKNCCRQVVKSSFDANASESFAPLVQHEEQLKGTAISGRHPAVSFNVGLKEKGKIELAKRLITLSRKCTQRALEEFLTTAKDLNEVPLSTRGKSAWDAAHPTVDPTVILHGSACNRHGQTEGASRQAVPPKGNVHSQMHIMRCPSCKESSVAVQQKIVPQDLSIRITCPVCRKRPTSAQWHCNCGVPWHRCPRHAAHQAATKAGGNRSRNTARRPPKRIPGNAEDLLDDDLMHESKKARLDLLSAHSAAQESIQRTRTIPMGMVPSALRARFPAAMRPTPYPMHVARGRPPEEPPD